MNRGKEIVVWALHLVVAAIFAIPFVLMIMTSVRYSEWVLLDPINLFLGGITLDNYARVWNEVPVLRYYANSLIVTSLIVGAQLITSVLAAYALGHLRPWGTRATRLAVVLVLSIPTPAIAITNFLAISSLGLTNTLSGLVVPFVASAFGVFLLTQYVEAVPDSQIDAARVFGLGPVRRFFVVVLPSIRPGITAFVAFSFVGWWNEFFWPFIALRDDTYATVPFLVRRFELTPNALPEWGPLMASATVALLPVVALLILLQRSFARTLSVSSR